MDWRALTEVRTEEAKKVRSRMMKRGKDWSPRRGKVLVPRIDNMANTVTSGQSKESLIVSMPTNGTNTPVKSTKNISESATQGTLLRSQAQTSQTMISLLVDSLVKHFQLQGKEKDLKTPEARSFLRSLGFSETKDPDILYSKMSKAYLVKTKGKLSRQYLGFSPTWGMSLSGRYLTAKISESPRIGKECSLSDILEEHSDPKYFLSQDKVTKILQSASQQKPQLLEHSRVEDTQEEIIAV